MEIKEPVKKYKTTNTIMYSCQYHCIWTTKYRRPVLNDKIQNRLKELILEKQQEYDFEVIEMETMSDHIHLLLSVNPFIGVYSVISRLKGYTSNILRKEFKELKSKLPTLWTRNKFISTCGSVSLEVVQKYIENQKCK
jgi:putative transposase